MNKLQPATRSTPVAAYIAVRDNRPFGNSNRVRGVTAQTTRSGATNGAGVSSALLGGTTTLQVNGHV